MSIFAFCGMQFSVSFMYATVTNHATFSARLARLVQSRLDSTLRPQFGVIHTKFVTPNTLQDLAIEASRWCEVGSHEPLLGNMCVWAFILNATSRLLCGLGISGARLWDGPQCVRRSSHYTQMTYLSPIDRAPASESISFFDAGYTVPHEYELNSECSESWSRIFAHQTTAIWVWFWSSTFSFSFPSHLASHPTKPTHPSDVRSCTHYNRYRNQRSMTYWKRTWNGHRLSSWTFRFWSKSISMIERSFANKFCSSQMTFPIKYSGACLTVLCCISFCSLHIEAHPS